MAITEVGNAQANQATAAPHITHGLTILEDDFVVISLVAQVGPTITDDNDTYALDRDFHEVSLNGQTYTVAIFSRVAGASEPADYAFSSDYQDHNIQIRVFRGVDTADPWDVAPLETNGDGGSSGTTATAPSVTTSTDGALAIAHFSTDGDVDYTNPTNGFGDGLASTYTPTQATFLKTIASAGAVGDTAATLSSSNDWFALIMALKPAGGAAGLSIPVAVHHYNLMRG